MDAETEGLAVATAATPAPEIDGEQPPSPLDAVAAELARLRAELARGHERAAAREHVIDQLHEQNERLRAGERQLLLRPLLTDLQRLRHEMLRAGDQMPERFSGRQAALLLHSYAHNLELTLERGGVVVVAPQPGDAFDPTIHRVTGTVAAADPGQDATVAEVVLDGYRDTLADRTVLAAAVLVHRWSGAADQVQAAGEQPGQPTDAPSI